MARVEPLALIVQFRLRVAVADQVVQREAMETKGLV